MKDTEEVEMEEVMVVKEVRKQIKKAKMVHSGFGTNLGLYGQYSKIVYIDYTPFLCSPDGIDISGNHFQSISNFQNYQ